MPNDETTPLPAHIFNQLLAEFAKVTICPLLHIYRERYSSDVIAELACDYAEALIAEYAKRRRCSNGN